MLHHGHQLHDVVSGRGDARQDQVAELRVCAHLLLLLRHADVRLVDEGNGERGTGNRVFPAVGAWVPHLGGEEVGGRILHNAARVCGQALSAPAVPAHLEPVELSVRDEPRGEAPFPHVAPRDAPQLEADIGLPSGEVPHEPHACGVWRPFAEDPSASHAVEAVVFVGVGEGGERAGGAGEGVAAREGAGGARAHGVGEWREPGIV